MIPQSKLEVNGICTILEKFGEPGKIRILDVSCGIGRHSIELAKRGFDVVGYDPSEFLIAYAQKWLNRLQKKTNLRLRFLHGKPLDLSKAILHEKFDAAITMGNSFGFVDEYFDSLLLRCIAKVLKPGAILIMQVENRDWTLKNFQPNKFRQTKNIQVLETWRFDAETSIFEGLTQFYKKSGQKQMLLRHVLDLRIRTRIYSLHELIRILRASGWSYKKSYESIQHLVSVKHDNQDIVIVSAKRT